MKTPVFYLIIMVFGLLLFGCGKTMKSTLPAGNNNNGSNGGTELLDCIKINGTLLDARVQTDPSSASYTLVKFTAHPTDFDEADTSIRFFSGIDTNSISTTSASYVVIHTATNSFLGSSGTGSTLDRPYLDTLWVSNLDLTDITLQINVGPNSRVLKIEMKQGSTVLDVVTSLIPAIDTNPNSYATNHPQSLVNMHPLLPYSNQGWTNIQLRQQGEYLCNQ